MPTKIIFQEDEPRIVELTGEEEYDGDPRLYVKNVVNPEIGRPFTARVAVGNYEYSGNAMIFVITFFPGLVDILVNETKTGEELGLEKVVSITHSSDVAKK